MGFKDNLQYLRGSHNMTQEQLAMLIGVSRQSVSKWESERRTPKWTSCSCYAICSA